MKYRLFSLLAFAGVLFSSCVKENFPAEGGSILAVMENDDTRTSVTDEGVFTWSEGDKVWLHTTSEGVVGTLSSGAGTASANFSYGSYFGEMTGRAVYPYNEGHSISGNVLNVVMPASYDLGSSLSNTNAAMYGVVSDGRLKFNHMAGVMRFKFKNVPAGVNKFTITLDKKISGTFTADLTEAFPVIETSDDAAEAEKTITLNFNALTETSDIALYIPLPLGTYNSLQLALYAGTNSVWTYSKSVTNTIARKSLKLMPTITLGGTIGGDIEGGESEDEDLYATIGGNSSSKTVMDENRNIRWSEGDQIVAFMKNSQGLKYQLNDSFAGETSGRFSKVLSESSGEVSTDVEWNHVVSYYPYDESVTCTRSEDNYLINVALPAEQAYAPESFGNATSPMAAISEDNHLTFNNLCGAIQFMFKGVANIRTIELKGNADELLSGNASVTVYPDGTVPSIAMSSGASKSIILDCGAGVQLNEDTATEFIMIVPPVTFAEGFTVTITDDQNAVATISTSRTCTINRSAMISMSSMEIETVQPDVPVVDPSALESANCHIVSEAGTYKFAAVKGNSTESVGDVASAEVLWESFGTDVTPSVGDLVKTASYKDGEITFQTSDTYKEGNAVIAAKDASGTILWSWHIWFTDQPQEHVYYNNAGTMMDRNLGATSATPGEVGALGLLYQWGRKDPFLGSASISYTVEAMSTITWPSAVSSASSSAGNVLINGTNEYATAHPTIFITYNSSNGDWYYTGDSSTDNTRWTTSDKTKSIYDPCPHGWRVPDGGSNGVWPTALGSSSPFTDNLLYDSTYKGINFSGKFGLDQTIWYPATGCRSYYDLGGLNSVGNDGNYWSVLPHGDSLNHGYYLNLCESGRVNPSGHNFRAFGFSVRCVQATDEVAEL